MKLGDLSFAQLRQRLADNDLALRTGPFVTQIHSPMLQVAEELHRLYAAFSLDSGDFRDFHVRIGPPTGLRR